MGITVAGTKKYFSMLFKNDTVEMLYFFIGLYLLITEAPELLIIDWAKPDIFRVLILIGIIASFSGIITRMIMSLFKVIMLSYGETMEKYRNKEWEIAPTMQNQAEVSAKQITEVIKKSMTEDEAKLNGLKQLDAGITEKHPELKQEIADLEAKLKDLE